MGYIYNLFGWFNCCRRKLKETGTSHWQSPNTDATNESGFTALPGGERSNDGRFYYVGISAKWWSSIEYSATNAHNWGPYFYGSSMLYGGYLKLYGNSVRCVKDF
jgi:uncharacterized protein (TIGR02145 family)